MGFERSVDVGWPLLAEYTECVQVKDAKISNGTITVAGEGDGQVRELLENLRDVGYVGFLALEPHLLIAGQRGGFSGADGMKMAADALRGLIAEVEQNTVRSPLLENIAKPSPLMTKTTTPITPP